MRDLGWNLFGIVVISWMVWIEILIQIEFAKGRGDTIGRCLSGVF